jgi:hypothetical protein
MYEFNFQMRVSKSLSLTVLQLESKNMLNSFLAQRYQRTNITRCNYHEAMMK